MDKVLKKEKKSIDKTINKVIKADKKIDKAGAKCKLMAKKK